MSSLTPTSVSLEDGDATGAMVAPLFAVLDSEIYQGPRWCVNCGGEKVFVEQFEFHGGRFGVCLGCGEEKMIPFSHTTSEAA